MILLYTQIHHHHHHRLLTGARAEEAERLSEEKESDANKDDYGDDVKVRWGTDTAMIM